MDLKEAIKINKEIMALIRSKYPGDPYIEHNTPESRYYYKLKQETERAEKYEGMESSRVSGRQ